LLGDFNSRTTTNPAIILSIDSNSNPLSQYEGLILPLRYKRNYIELKDKLNLGDIIQFLTTMLCSLWKSIAIIKPIPYLVLSTLENILNDIWSRLKELKVPFKVESFCTRLCENINPKFMITKG